MWIFDNMAQLLMVTGVTLAVIDILFLGFATFYLTLIGLATLTTGLLVLTGVLSEDWTHIAISVAALAAIYSAILWRPLTLLQQKGGEVKTVSTDLTGHTFLLSQDISPSEPGEYAYSGVTWKLETEQTLKAGTKVVVTEVQVGIMKVKAASN
mgnify:FL=1